MEKSSSYNVDENMSAIANIRVDVDCSLNHKGRVHSSLDYLNFAITTVLE
jgi:hypothetical protein